MWWELGGRSLEIWKGTHQVGVEAIRMKEHDLVFGWSPIVVTAVKAKKKELSQSHLTHTLAYSY